MTHYTNKQIQSFASHAVTITIFNIIMFFIGPLLMMYGWNIIAWESNLPQFNYLHSFCICNGLHWFIKGFRK